MYSPEIFGSSSDKLESIRKYLFDYKVLTLTFVFLVCLLAWISLEHVILLFLHQDPSTLFFLSALKEIILTLFVWFLLAFLKSQQRTLSWLKNSMDNVPEGIIFTDPQKDDNPIVRVNEAFLEQTGYDRQEVLGINCRFLQGDDTNDQTVQKIREAIDNEETITTTLINYRKDGIPFHNELTISPVYDDNQKLIRFVGIQRDITERITSKKQLKKALDEKTTLLQEVHHRVKNNLQVLLGLLGLQSREIDDPDALKAIKTSKDRIQSMAMVHEHLYNRNLHDINFEVFLKQLINRIHRSGPSSENSPEFEIDVSSHDINPDLAIHCGLLVNELVTNSLEHAFPERDNSKISVEFYIDQDLNRHLIVSDNGKGIKAEQLKESDSLGMKLVRRLSEEQLNGELRMTESDGLRTEIIFPPPQDRDSS